MHLLNSDPLKELRDLQRALANKRITQAEFDLMYRDLDRTNAAALCDNGDSRIAVQMRGGRRLCGVCLLRLGNG
jgi:hypothetical protein